MAATEYYMGTAAAHQMQGQNTYQPQHQFTHQYPQSPNQLQTYTNDKPPSYSPYPPTQQQPQQQQPRPQTYQPHPYQQSPQGYAPQPQPYPPSGPPPTAYSPHPQTPQMRPQGYPQQPQNAYLSEPLHKQRSHSQPPRGHFADRNEYDSDSGTSYASDDESPRRRHKRHHHHHHHHHHRDYDPERRERVHEKSHKDRNTFLGAGAGGVIGDAIFPGLGTVGGLLLGGYGGRRHASKQERSRSEERYGEDEGGYRPRHRESGRGWDEGSATYKKGLAVR